MPFSLENHFSVAALVPRVAFVQEEQRNFTETLSLSRLVGGSVPGILQRWTKVNAVTRQTLLDNAVMQIVRVSPQNLEKSMMSVEGSGPS